MLRPTFPRNAKTERVYGTVLREDFLFLFREVLPAWGSSRRVIAHLINILVHHVRRNRIHDLPTNEARSRAVEQLFTDMLLADFPTGRVMGKERLDDGQRDST